MTDESARVFQNLPRTGGRTLVMGVVNLTPDSFYDGGRYPTAHSAIDRALELAAAGADIIDLGGESSRPGSNPVSAGEELKRVIPVIAGLAGRLPVPISIDTWKAEVAARALEAGAKIVNDISALRFDPGLAPVVAAAGGPYVMMHMLGTPRDMQERPVYRDPIGEIKEFFRERIAFAAAAGIDPERVVIDPGIGFGKTLEHNLEILNGLGEFRGLGRPVLVGVSRKSFIGAILGRGPEDRLWGTAGAVASAIWRGADIVRVHDVGPLKEMIAVIDRIKTAGAG
jgi:dihydropteroate synthase